MQSCVEISYRSTSAPHLANIPLRTGRKIKWDGTNELTISDAEASKWLSRRYRAPWKLLEALSKNFLARRKSSTSRC
jgi:hypothetical protein